MIKACVKKPFTVFVAVIVCLTLAAVSLTEMRTDLLPEMTVPYLLIITTYPGASPEKVESTVAQPLEGQLGTVSRVKGVTSTSSENYAMIMLEFEDDTNMDSAMVKVNAAIQQTALPEECGKPTIMEMSMDMVATQYLAIDWEGKDLYQLSDFVKETAKPFYERQEGVSSVTGMGLVEKRVEVRLNQDKIDKVNEKVLKKVNKKLAESKEDIDKARRDLNKAESKLKKGDKKLSSQEKSTANQMAEATKGLNTALATKAAYEAELASEKANQAALQMELKAYEDGKITETYEQLDTLFAQLHQAAGSDEAKKAMEETLYQQFLIATVQQLVDSAAGSAAQGAQAPQGGDAAQGSQAPESGASSSEGDQSGTEAQNPQSSQSDSTEQGAESSQAAQEPKEEGKKKVTVTAENVDSILNAMGASVAKATRQSVREAAQAATEEQIAAIQSQYPESISDALKHPKKLEAARAMLLEQGQDQAAEQLTVDKLTELERIVKKRIPNIETELENLAVRIATSTAVTQQVTKAVSKALESYSAVEAGKILAAAGFGSADAQLAAAKSSIKSGKEQLDSALESYEEGKKAALKNANINPLIKPETLSQLLYAQNFAMPAGTLKDKTGTEWSLKIGDNFQSVEELSHMLLSQMDGVGKIRLEDVADISVVDNAGEGYTRINGKDAVVLAVYKNSTASTSDVARTCNKATAKLQEQYPGLRVTPLMDQGAYISLFLDNMGHSMLIGAALAILVLILFLKDLLPTVVVAFSIPFSLLVALLLMYFSNISLNIMSLGGLSLGIGMLVDNSIVVIENIYRLRGRGMTAPRAAVQGARQVNGPIIASTLTTICVFLPMIFTSGITRQLMLPFALTIGYSLTASLLVALTVVPTISSVLLRRTRTVSHPVFDRMVELYAGVLDFCLRVKLVPLTLALALLVFSVVGVFRMGAVMVPEMASDQVEITINVDEDADLSKEQCFALVDDVTDRLLKVDGVDTLGALGNASSMITGMSSDNYRQFSLYAAPRADLDTEAQVFDLVDRMRAAVADVKNASITMSASSMGDMSALMGAGLSLNLYGDDLDELTRISHELEDVIAQVEGFEDISNGQEKADETLHLVINRDKAMKLGLTTAQIFSQLSSELKTDTDAIKLTLDGTEVQVTIVDETKLPTREKLLKEVFEVTVTNDEGKEETEKHKLKEFATVETAEGFVSIGRQRNERYLTVSASTKEGYNTSKLVKELKPKLEQVQLPEGYHYELSGEYENVSDMITQMLKMTALGFLFIYLVMVAQFQSLLSPFIVIFTVPLAFTGGFLGLLAGREQLSLFAMMGFLVLMGTVVNNGIVFVDYTNQLRLGGLSKRDALIATGKTRMRPILMTAMTTILAMSALVFDRSTSAGMSRGMALVVAGGLLYATLMTLIIVPVMYDLLYRRQPRVVDVGTDEELDAAPDDAQEFLAQQKS